MVAAESGKTSPTDGSRNVAFVGRGGSFCFPSIRLLFWLDHLLDVLAWHALHPYLMVDRADLLLLN